MGFIEAFLLALALCVDSLVVSATTAFRSRLTARRGLLLALIFGLCQGGFPLLGALIGDVARAFIEVVDHWVAFGLLALIGGKMIVDAIGAKHDSPDEHGANGNSPLQLVLLGVATSIDAFAVGIGLGLQHPLPTVLWVVALIGAITFAVSLLGVWLGNRRIPIPERIATLVAGLVLVGLGVKILVEHLFL